VENGRNVGPGRHPSARQRGDVITMLTPGGPLVIVAPDPRARSLIASHLNAVRRYVETGDARRLRRFERLGIRFDDRTTVEFVTDPATIDRLAEGSALHFELYRR
jgi:hypothetical protein